MSARPHALIRSRVACADLAHVVKRRALAEQADRAARVAALVLRDPAHVAELLRLVARPTVPCDPLRLAARAFLMTFDDLEQRCRAWPGTPTAAVADGLFAAAWARRQHRQQEGVS